MVRISEFSELMFLFRLVKASPEVKPSLPALATTFTSYSFFHRENPASDIFLPSTI